MSDTSSIEWTDATWNCIRGCSIVSPGCKLCYAMKIAHRFDDPADATSTFHGLTELGPNGPRWNGKVRTVPKKLTDPLHWRKPRRVFVNSMADLFHEDVPFEFIDLVFAVMALTPQHTYQILTKRPGRMREYILSAPKSFERGERTMEWVLGMCDELAVEWAEQEIASMWERSLPNVWLGVSAENQQYADERIPLLLQTPAAIRFVSYEPALGPVDFRSFFAGRMSSRIGIDWIIVGGESGPGARSFDVSWARSVIEQCRNSNVACFVKQLGGNPYGSQEDDEGLCIHDRKGGDMSEWPEDLRVREFPLTASAR